MKAEPDLLIGVQGIEVNLAVIAKGVEVVEQSGAAVAVAELEVVADAIRFVDVVSVVAFGEIDGGIVGGEGLIDVVEDLVAGRDFGKVGRLRLETGALLLSLVAVEDADWDGNLEAESVVDAGALVFAAEGGIGGAVGIGQLDVGVGKSDGLAGR